MIFLVDHNMDKLEHYRHCVEELLLEYGKEPPVNGEIEVEVVFDKERDRYLIINLGWNEHHRVYNCFMHLDIKDGKIFVKLRSCFNFLLCKLLANSNLV